MKLIVLSAGFKRVPIVGLLVGVLVLGSGVVGALEIGNGSVRVEFDGKSGGLLRVWDVSTGKAICEPAEEHRSLWHIYLSAGGGAVTPEAAGAFRSERVGPASLALTWSEFPAPLSRLQVRATVVTEDKKAMARWHLQVRGLEAPPHSVLYPRLRGLRSQTNEWLAVPLWMGQVVKGPREKVLGSAKREGQLRWDYPGHLSMQCLAFYGEDGTGLYLACNDTAAFRKNFVMKGDASRGLHFEIEHLPERGGAGSEWTMPYEIISGPLHGDWVTAAETYRGWATNQAWARESRLARGQVPEWVEKTSLWVWNRGRSESVLSPALELQQRLKMPVSVFWHWWHGCSYDAGFPEYFPPREGTEQFKRQMRHAHEHDVRALVYMNQRLWGMSTPSWRDEGAAVYAVKSADGTIRPEIYNTFTGAECASMCMGTEFWRNKYAGLAEQAVKELGVDGIYMDQACTSLACYDTAHPHPAGGGKYWVEGFRKMQQDIRDRCRTARRTRAVVGLAGEGTGEAWLPYLDIMLSLQVSKERYAGPDGWEPIPFFHAVYHAYAISYGNYSSLTMPPYDELWPVETAPSEPLQLLDRKFSRQFYLEQARAFVWGQQPTIANFLPRLSSERREEIDYTLRLARLRAQATGYLQNGTFVSPPGVLSTSSRIAMSRLSIYAGQHGGVREFEKETPDALAAGWLSPEGKLGVAVASIAEKPVEVTLDLGGSSYAGVKGKGVWRLDEQGRRRVPGVTGDRLQVKLPALGACVLEFGD